MATRLFHMIAVTDAGVWIVRGDGYVAQMPTSNLTDVRVFSGVPARFAVLNRAVVLVNAVSQPIFYDSAGASHYLSLRPPAAAPTLAAGVGTGLTGAYKVWVSFLMKDEVGNVIGQSPLSPASSAFTLANQNLLLTNIPISSQGGTSINARRIYRSTVGGSVPLAELDIDDNTTTTLTLGVADAALSTVAAPTTTLGTAPSRLTNIVQWKNRLWACSDNLPDTLFASNVNEPCAWPLSFSVGPAGDDYAGITGFLPRRDELGVCKRKVLWKMTGDATANFRLVKLVEEIGVGAPDSCRVIRDEGFFLGGPGGVIDGIYRWNGSGVASVSDSTVRPWFTTDTYFNRSQFPFARGAYHPGLGAYLLFLSAVGSTVLDRWVAFDVTTGKFYGPHKTAAFSPSAPFVGYDSAGNSVLMIGGTDGNVYRVAPGVYTDGSASAIDMDIFGKPHAGAPPMPDVTKVWLQSSIFTAVEAGDSLSITPYLGDSNAVAGTTQTHSLLLPRERMKRFGVGRLCQLRLQQATLGRGCTIFGYEIPYAIKGRR